MDGTPEFVPTQAADALLMEYSELLRNRILAKAKEIAAARQFEGDTGTTEDQSVPKRNIEGMHMALAIQDFDAGHPPPAPTPPPGPSWRSRILESITGVTIISMVLALAFGFLGVLASSQTIGNKDSYLDIAKLFAGAIVGSTGAAAVVATRR
jgi:hypothetical protein